MLYWAQQRKISDFTFPRSADFTDGGIYSTAVSIQPTNPDRLAQRLELDSWIRHKITFYNCHIIEPGSAIMIGVPIDDYQDISPTCTVFEGVYGKPKKLESEMSCLWDATNKYFIITGFLEIRQLTKISVIYNIKSKDTAMAAIGDYVINSCLLYTSPSPRDRQKSRMPSSA
eukprot:TRINITY_DN17392_c0_g1_i1.p3 TRINITY_DN17392_c0_g1~~TRINITY_DN17392_c0_g1_i1.p3  ORF type:complete len:172 (+),score=32.41 TRINITY_DN17392_c0_g1_i1:1422-1937(+)